jgi:hypothetical protein
LTDKDQNEGVLASMQELMMANTHLKEKLTKLDNEKKQMEKNIKTMTTKLVESEKKNKNYERITDWDNVLDHFRRGRVNVDDSSTLLII